MEEFLKNLKITKGYDDQLLDIISNIIMAYNEVLGDENMPNVLQAINNVQIILYDDVQQASSILSHYFNNGKKYIVGSQGTGTGFTEDEYILDENGNIRQYLVIGLDKNSIKIQTLIHELCHAISSIKGEFVKDNILYTNSGFNLTSYDFSNGTKGGILSNQEVIFNEIVTENLAMQVMDAYDKTISHEATAYNGYASNFKYFFRNANLNKAIIDSYINHDNNFVKILDEIVDQQVYLNCINSMYNEIDSNNSAIKEYLDKLSKSTFSEFFALYRTYMNKKLGTLDGINKSDFKIIKDINQWIIFKIGKELKNKEYNDNVIL